MPIYLEAVLDNSQLKIGVYNSSDVIWHYMDICVPVETIQTICCNMADTLNKIARQGDKDYKIVQKLKTDGEILAQSLLTPGIIKKLKKTNHKDLIIKIDENLVHIPWELMYFDHNFLSLHFNTGRIVKTRQILPDTKKRESQSPVSMWILADPESNLAGADSEGIAICRFMDLQNSDTLVVDAVLNNKVTKEEINERLFDFDFVHFAGHSEYHQKNRQMDGWKITDGLFSVKDIDSMADSRLPMPFFVFTNGCQSARTEKWEKENDINYSLGLANAFLISGVKHYLGTCWEIVDEQGSCFAKEFYFQMLSGKSIGQCVRLARQKLIKKYGTNSTIWASYILYGDPGVKYFYKGEKPEEYKSEKAIISESKDDQTDKTSTKKVLTRSHKKQIIFPFAGLLLLLAVTFSMFYIFNTNSNKNHPSPQLLQLLVKEDQKKQTEITRLIEKIQLRFDKNKKIDFKNDLWTSSPLTMVIDFDSVLSRLNTAQESMIFALIQKQIIDTTKIICLERKNFLVLLQEADISTSNLASADTKWKPDFYSPEYLLFLTVQNSNSKILIIFRLVHRKRAIYDVWHEVIEKNITVSNQTQKLCETLLLKLKQIEKKYPLRGKIVKVKNNNTIIMNIGSNTGVIPGQKFFVLDKNIVLKVKVVKEKITVLEFEKEKVFLEKGLKTEILSKT